MKEMKKAKMNKGGSSSVFGHGAAVNGPTEQLKKSMQNMTPGKMSGSPVATMRKGGVAKKGKK